MGTAVGSPGFLAPEQVRGAAVTPATDVFSLGATLAYAAMADSPFGHGSSEVMLYRVVHEEPQLHGVPDALAPLIRACLAKDPEDRPSTLQLSMRLKEIAAREAQGLPVSRPPVQRERSEERGTVRPTERYTEYTERDTRGRGPERAGEQGPERGSDRGSERGQGRGLPRGPPPPGRGPGLPAPAVPSRHQARRPLHLGRPPPRQPRLLRQRLFVFVVVTLIVALGIAAAQALQG